MPLGGDGELVVDGGPHCAAVVAPEPTCARVPPVRHRQAAGAPAGGARPRGVAAGARQRGAVPPREGAPPAAGRLPRGDARRGIWRVQAAARGAGRQAAAHRQLPARGGRAAPGGPQRVRGGARPERQRGVPHQRLLHRARPPAGQRCGRAAHDGGRALWDQRGGVHGRGRDPHRPQQRRPARGHRAAVQQRRQHGGEHRLPGHHCAGVL
mmetsp:Transcript_42685/g.109279  ORF Transcript_42685/g.109279 Transcript_42685/m.109279 type:complete len:210 (+) Transcript_42685:746-1375(+)